MKEKIIALLAALLLLSGCVMISSEQKQKCIALATIPETSILDCKSIEECSAKSQEKLTTEYFGDAFVDEELNKWKQSISLNWLYYNKAKNSLKEIRKACESSSQQALIEKTNEVSYNLKKSAEYLQEAQKNQFAAISLQEARLRKEKISEIKEEEIYGFFTTLNEILNQGQNSENNFLKKNQQASAKLKELLSNSKLGAFEAEITERDLLEGIMPEILSQIRPVSLTIILGKKAADELSQKLNNAQKLSAGIEELEGIAAEKTAKAIENYTGGENSLASEFKALMQKQKQLEKTLEKENNQRMESAQKILESNSEKIAAMQSSEFLEFDSEFLQELMQELGISAKVQLRKNEFQNLSEFQKNALSKNQGLLEQLAKEKNSKKTIGEKTKNIKEIEKNSTSLQKELALVEKENFEKTLAACRQKAQKAKESIQALAENDFLALEAKKNSEKTLAENNAEAILACKKMLEGIKQLKEKNQNPQEFDKNSEKNSKACIEEIEKTKANELPSIKEKYSVLKELVLLGLEPEKAEIECEKLKEQAMQEAEEETKELQELWNSIKQEKPENKATLEKMKSLEKYFTQSLESAAARARLKQELEESLQSLKNSVFEEKKQKAIKQIQENAKIEITANEMAEANKEQKITVKLVLESPEEISEKTEIRLPFLIDGKGLPEENLESTIKDNNSTILVLKKIKKGENAFWFESTEIPATTEETTKNTLCNEEKAIFQKKIRLKIKEKTTVPQLKIAAIIPENSRFVNAENNSKTIQASQNKNEIALIFEDAENNDEINLWIEIGKPIEKEQELIEEREENSKTIQELRVKVKNTSGESLENCKIPLENLENSAKVTAFSEEIEEKKITKNPFGTFLIEEKLPANSEKNYEIIAEFTKESFEWQTMLENAKQTIIGLLTSENQEIAQNATELLENAQFLSENFSENNKQDKKDTLNIFQKARALETEQKIMENKKEQAPQSIETKTADKNQQTTTQTLEQTQKAKDFLQRAKKLLEKKETTTLLFEKLSKNMQNFSKQEMTDTKYLPPMTKEEIEKEKLAFERIAFEKIEEAMQKITDLNENGKTEEAEKLAAESEKTLESAENAIKSSQKLRPALQELKQDAKAILEKTSKSLNEAKENKQASFLLEKAQNELAKENYTKTIQYASFADALITLNTDFTLPELPLSLIPLLAIAITAYFLKKNKEKAEKTKQENIKKILKKAEN